MPWGWTANLPSCFFNYLQHWKGPSAPYQARPQHLRAVNRTCSKGLIRHRSISRNWSQTYPGWDFKTDEQGSLYSFCLIPTLFWVLPYSVIAITCSYLSLAGVVAFWKQRNSGLSQAKNAYNYITESFLKLYISLNKDVLTFLTLIFPMQTCIQEPFPCSNTDTVTQTCHDLARCPQKQAHLLNRHSKGHKPQAATAKSHILDPQIGVFWASSNREVKSSSSFICSQGWH